MQAAVTCTIASVGAVISGSGTSVKRMSNGACRVVARMCVILADEDNTTPRRVADVAISHI
jgi:hypothetical protein